MKVHKFIWKKKDTFETIRNKLISLKGKQVINNYNEKMPLTIFNVGEIEEMVLECIGNGFFSFLNGDPKYTSSDGGYNFKGNGKKPMWGFFVEFGCIDSRGYTMTQKHNFMIPRESDFKSDLKKNRILYLPNHPFIFYEL